MTETVTVVDTNVSIVTLLSSCHNIVCIDHETGNTSQYDSVIGTLIIALAYAFNGTNFGMGAGADGDTLSKNFGIVTTAIDNDQFSMRFYVNGIGISIPEDGQSIVIFSVYAWGDPFMEVRLVNYEGALVYIVRVYEDHIAFQEYTYASGLADYIEIRMTSETIDGDNDGTMEAWISGAKLHTITGIGNRLKFNDLSHEATFNIGVVDYGADSEGIFGTVALDEIVINDTGEYIGP